MATMVCPLGGFLFVAGNIEHIRVIVMAVFPPFHFLPRGISGYSAPWTLPRPRPGREIELDVDCAT